MIDFLASEPHYENHLRPIKAKLLELYSLDELAATRQVTVVASQKDAETVQGHFIYIEHGAGQSYGRELGYGGRLRPGLVRRLAGVICPGEEMRARWLAREPFLDVAAVGCPKLDPYVGMQLDEGWSNTVAITFHWPCAVTIESGSAFQHYAGVLPGVVRRWRSEGYEILGHGHPRFWRHLEPFWGSIGVEPVPDEDEIFCRAGALIGDNTSLLPEFMALGRPVIFLDDPKWRRNVRLGGRFWEWPAAAVSVANSEHLSGVDLASDIAFSGYNLRTHQGLIDSIYAFRDGHSAERAAQFIYDLTRRD